MNNMSRDIELEKQIDAYIKGKLTEEESRELWEALLQRPDYIELLETELGVKSIMEKRASADTDRDEQSVADGGVIYTLQKSWKWIAAAAAVALLAVTINVLQLDTERTLREMAVQNIDISTNLASAPVLRSQKASITPADSLLNRGFEAAISGNMNRALAMYDQIIEKFGNEPAAVQALLNKGIIQYNRSEYGNAIGSFEKVLASVRNKPVAKEKAHWYMGNAYINTDELEKAREAIYEAYSMDGIYRQSAHRILQKLDEQLEGSVLEGDRNQQ